ncbi:MAG: hypothetical protein LBS30_03505 [Planctomycetota bacterium]|jgi:hypothetical protein|nr:hypothetical protein [Planctomycetota bacterium]
MPHALQTVIAAGAATAATTALALCLAWQPPLRAAETARNREEYSSSASSPSSQPRRGQTLRLTLAPARSQPRAIVLPKSLAELQKTAGEAYLCAQRGNFLVAGDLGPAEYEYLVDGVLEYCAAALTTVFFDREPVPGKIVNILIFKDYDSYETGLRRFLDMDPISPYGHYGHSQKYIVVNYETGPGTMVHELTHALMSEDFPEAPIWLAEGMASLYEHCRAEGDILRGDDNWRLPELKAALETDSLTPLTALLAMPPSVFRGHRESLNYAQARYFCKYLEEMGLLPAMYKGFRNRFGQDPTGARFIAQAFGKPLEAVETSWKRWIAFQHWKE